MKKHVHFSILLFFIILTGSGLLKAQKIHYVKTAAAGAGDGSSWNNASSDLQAIIDLSTANDQIWVAAGTYKPKRYPTNCIGCTSNLDYAFLLKDGVKLYGGFLGSEADISSRNPSVNITNLNGDLNGDGTLRTYHVILSIGDTPATVLDGFKISGGGGSTNTTVTLESENITRRAGGGLISYNSSLSVNQCMFTENTGSAFGSGMYMTISAAPTFNNCVFYKNINLGGGGGGAGYIVESTPTFNNCNFIENFTSSSGGGFYIHNCSPKFNACIFSKNQASLGGAIFNVALGSNSRASSDIELKNCIISQNSAVEEGGGICSNAYSSYPNSAFSGSSPNHCVFFGNSAKTGGAIFHGDTRSTANTLSYIHNSIFWNNTGGSANNFHGYAGNSIFEDFAYRGSLNTEISNVDPLFIDATDPDGPDNIWRTADDGLQLGFCSPAIDASSPTSYLTEIDILGNNRYNTRSDIGAYERQSPACQVYTSTDDCQTMTINNVNQNRLYRFFNSNGLVAEINPNGLKMGTVTISISDPTGIINYNNGNFLGRSISVTSSNYPDGTTMPENYILRLYYTNTELEEYKTSTSENIEASNFNVAWKSGENGCTLESHAGNSTGMIKKTEITNGKLGTSDTGFYLEFLLNHLTIFVSTTSELNPLPVSLVSFTGKNEKTYNILHWQTAAEINNAYFEIQRSSDGKVFQRIGEQIRGSGTSNMINNYSFQDMTFSGDINYYRLKQVDLDGKFSMSRIIAISNKKMMSLYPNPVTNELFINTSVKEFTYQITDINGRKIRKGTSLSSNSIKVSDLSAGIYLITFNGQVLKFVKN